jgi:iron complex outermembrane receptor protein
MNYQAIASKQRQPALFACKLTCGLLLGTGLVPASVFAQQASTGSSDQLVEIVVTAQRREQNLQDTPIAVSAFNGQELQERGVSSVLELAQVDPSLNIGYNQGIVYPFLRGIGNLAAGSVGNESSVAVYIDDVYYTRLSAAYLALGDIERVEVLNGPQGTLFGRNTSGGAITMFTKDPGQKPELDATIGYANYNTTSGQFYASTPITDTLAWNIAFGGSDQRDGWGHSVTTGQDAYLGSDYTVRSKLIWEPSDATRIKIVGFYAYSDGDLGLAHDLLQGTYGKTAALPAPGYPNPPMVLPSLANSGGFYDTRFNFPNTAHEEGYGGSLRIDQDIGFAGLVSITAFRNSKGYTLNDSDFSPQNFYNDILNETDRQLTQEFQIKSKSGSKIDWIVGAYYLHSRAGYDPAVVYGDLLNYGVAPGATESIFGIQTINSYSIYGQTTAPIGETTNLTVGLRGTSDYLSGAGSEFVTIQGVGNIPAGPNYSNSKDFGAMTWKVAIDHHFTPNVMGYVSDSRGYKAGTYDTVPLDAPPARPEIVDAYELGVKSEFFDRRLRLNTALFWNQIKDPQVLTIINQGVASGVGLVNAQEARTRGVEIGFDAIAAEGLKLRGAASYLDATYTEFTNAPFYSGGLTPGSTLTGPVLGDASGNRLPEAPTWRFDAGANYTLNTSVGEWVGDVGASYRGKVTWFDDNSYFEKSVTLVNASLNFTPSSWNHMTISVWGKNLGNVKYYTFSVEQSTPLGTGGYIAGAAPPLTFGGTVSVKF